jgi:hypothetical protein
MVKTGFDVLKCTSLSDLIGEVENFIVDEQVLLAK